MKTTIFAKRIKSHDGKSFTIFVTNLERKDGTQQYMKVMYTGKDKNKNFDSDACPMVIEFDCKNKVTQKGRTPAKLCQSGTIFANYKHILNF